MAPKLEYLKHITNSEVSPLMQETVWYRRKIIRSVISAANGIELIGQEMPRLFDTIGMVSKKNNE